MLVHRRVTPQHSVKLSNNLPVPIVYTWVERGTVRVNLSVLPKNTTQRPVARNWTRTVQSKLQLTLTISHHTLHTPSLLTRRGIMADIQWVLSQSKVGEFFFQKFRNTLSNASVFNNTQDSDNVPVTVFLYNHRFLTPSISVVPRRVPLFPTAVREARWLSQEM